MEVNELKQQIIDLALSDPDSARLIAEEFGFWEDIKGEIITTVHRALCRHDPNAFIEYIVVDPETGKLAEQQDFHIEWQRNITDYKRVLIVAPRGHGKCQVRGTKLYLDDGSRVNVEDIPLGQPFKCLSWTPELGYTHQTARVWKDAIQQSYRIHTKSGRTTGYSEEHPCWTQRGWVAAKDLTVGDTFAVARNMPGGSVEYPRERAWLLGLLLGDGGLTTPSRVSLTCADPLLLSALPGVAKSCGFQSRIDPSPDLAKHIALSGGATQWIRGFGLDGKSSHTKFIPPEVFAWDNESVSALIQGYFDADGCVGERSKVVEFSSVNRDMLGQVQSLLLRFGVVSSIRIKNGTYKSQPHVSHRLQINGSSLTPFAALIGQSSSKGVRVQALVNRLGKANDNIDLIPDAVIDRYNTPRGARADRLGNSSRLDTRRKRGQTRSRVNAFLDNHPNEALRREADLFWDEITQIDFLGAQQTYSVEVDNTHTHVTDDFITHNTMQVVARIIWEIGNDYNIRVKIIGSTDDKAKEILGLVKDMIDNDPKVKEIFPDLVIDTKRGDTKSAFFVKRSNTTMRDPTCEAAGVLSAGAGGRADLLVCDDVVDMKNSVINPATREQVIRTVKETWFSLVSPEKGRIVWIATPYHKADATHNLLEAGAIWKVWWTPAEIISPVFDEDGDPVYEEYIDPTTNKPAVDENGKLKLRPKVHVKYLWPDKWGANTLRDKRIELGERVYTRQYLLKAMSDDERTFPDADLEASYDYTIHDIGVGIDDDWPTFGGIDLASALGIKNAYTVIFTVARNPYNNKLYWKSIVRKRMGFTKTVDAICGEFRRHKWRKAYVENNGYQRIVEEAVDEELKDVPLAGFHTSPTGKANEQIGLPGLSVAFSKGTFAIPAAHFPLQGDDLSSLSIVMGELQSHPGGDFTDTVMALWFAYRAAIEGMSNTEDLYVQVVGF